MMVVRRGFTFVETMLVMVSSSIVAAMSLPHFRAASSGAAIRSARQQTAVYVSQARALAMQRGREARFVRAGNVVKVTVDSSGTQVLYAASRDLHRESGVSLSSTRDTIAFDPRGFALGTGSIEQVSIARDGQRDSVCVTKFGVVISRGCAL